MTDKITELVQPQTRLELEKQVESEYEIARGLLNRRKYKEALKKFKWVFANYGPGNRNNMYFDRPEIRRLIKNYRPAVAVIRRWRNDKEKLILSQTADFEIIREWDRLNAALGEKQRTLEVFFKLQAANADEEIQQAILSGIWKKLARSKQYDHLKLYFRTLGFFLLHHIVEYDCAIWFPRNPGARKRDIKDNIKSNYEWILGDGPLTYEIALGLGERQLAAEFAKRILGVETSDNVYASLIKGAIRAHAYPEANTLYGEAQEHFSLRRLRHSSAAVKAIPQSKRNS